MTFSIIGQQAAPVKRDSATRAKALKPEHDPVILARVKANEASRERSLWVGSRSRPVKLETVGQVEASWAAIVQRSAEVLSLQSMAPEDSLEDVAPVGREAADSFTCSIEKSFGPLAEAALGASAEDFAAYCHGGLLVEVEGEEVHAVRCKSAVCKRCAGKRAYDLATRLGAVLGTFVNPMFWTLTIDPKACPDPRRIWDHLRSVAAICELVRSLGKRGHLASRRYFCVVEFQMGERIEDGREPTQQVHLHILLDAVQAGIPHAVVHERWQRFKPEWAAERPGYPGLLGFVQYEPVKRCEGMAWYLVKYVAKGPQDGMPGWWLEMLDEPREGRNGRNCTLWSASQGFWPKDPSKPAKRTLPEKLPKPPKPFKKRVPVAERVASCCTKANKFHVKRWMAADGTSVDAEYRYLGTMAESWGEVSGRYGQDPEERRSGVLRAIDFGVAKITLPAYDAVKHGGVVSAGVPSAESSTQDEGCIHGREPFANRQTTGRTLSGVQPSGVCQGNDDKSTQPGGARVLPANFGSGFGRSDRQPVGSCGPERPDQATLWPDVFKEEGWC